MLELVVVLNNKADHAAIKAIATITWESKLTPMLVVTVDDEAKIASLSELPGVERVEQPKVGTVMV